MKVGTPRIIGILLIIIAALIYFTGLKGWTGLGVAGIILLIASANYTQKILDKLIAAISDWKTLFITALYDAIYWLLIFGSMYFFQWRFQVKSAAAQASTVLTKEAMLSPQLTAQNAAQIQGFFYFILISAILLLVFSFLAYSITRGFIWTTIARQKADKKFFKQWILLNLGWWAIWLPVFFIVAIATATKGTTTASGSIIFIMFVAAYFTVITHTLYLKTRKKGYSIANGFGFGLSKLHQLIVPYTYAFVIYIIFYQIFRIFETTTAMRPVAMLFVILFTAWLRIYLYNIIKEFK